MNTPSSKAGRCGGEAKAKAEVPLKVFLQLPTEEVRSSLISNLAEKNEKEASQSGKRRWTIQIFSSPNYYPKMKSLKLFCKRGDASGTKPERG
jgi:hypothetical protein